MPVTWGGKPLPPPSVQEQLWRREAELAMRQATEVAHGQVLREMEPNRKTGTSMRSVATEVHAEVGTVEGRVGTNYRPVRYQSEGTGIYGERHTPIVPVHAKALRFPQPGGGGFTLAGRQRSGKAGAGAQWVFARSVRGVRPKRYFQQAAHAARGEVRDVFAEAGRRFATALGVRA